jgi:hypothetical protein
MLPSMAARTHFPLLRKKISHLPKILTLRKLKEERTILQRRKAQTSNRMRRVGKGWMG